MQQRRVCYYETLCNSLFESQSIFYFHSSYFAPRQMLPRGHHGRDRIIVRFTTICAISAYHHWKSKFKPCSWKGVLETTLCDTVCQRIAPDRIGGFLRVLRFPPTNKTDRHDIAEILLKVVLNTINLNQMMANQHST